MRDYPVAKAMGLVTVTHTEARAIIDLLGGLNR
jgi:hypothetical protein